MRWRAGFVEMQLVVRPELRNAGDILHGGVLMTLLDSACGGAASFDAHEGPVSDRAEMAAAAD